MNQQKNQIKQDRMLPPVVAAILRLRDNKDYECPEEILNRIESLKIGKIVYNFKGQLHQSSSQNSLNNWRGSKVRDFRLSNNSSGGSWDSKHSPSMRKTYSEQSLGSDDSYRGLWRGQHPGLYYHF